MAPVNAVDLGLARSEVVPRECLCQVLEPLDEWEESGTHEGHEQNPGRRPSCHTGTPSPCPDRQRQESEEEGDNEKVEHEGVDVHPCY